MKVEFYLEMFLRDERDNDKTVEVVCLKHISQMSFTPQIGMTVIIGKNEEELSEHEVKEITWMESDDSLYVRLDEFETTIDEGESDERGWEYFDGLKNDFVEKDGWEIIEIRGIRK